MHLRPYNALDVSATADVKAVASQNDPLFRYVFRDISRCWASYRANFVRLIHTRAITPGSVIWVVESDAGDAEPTDDSLQTDGGDVLGWAAWSRRGHSPVARNWQRVNETLSVRLELQLQSLRNMFYEVVPGIDPSSHRDHLARARPLLESAALWDEEVFPEFWELDLMMVDERYHRRGVGRMLLEWGTRQAGWERVPVLVQSSPVGKRFYENGGGFQVLKRCEEIDELFDCGEEGCCLLVWEPEGRKGEWVDMAKRKIEEEATTKVKSG